MSEKEYDQEQEQGQGKQKSAPSHRVSFARINGRDTEGRDILGPAREIGAIWPQRDKDGHGVLRFDHIPEEMRGRSGGVLFVKALDAAKEGVKQGQETGAKPPAKDKARDVDRER